MKQTSSVNNSVVRCGYLKKLKTSKRKWFVLRAETADSSARLEYYDSERKFNNGLRPKRSIPLKNCFNINRRLDTKHKHVIALYTKDDCFCVGLDNEEDVENWLKALLELQHGEEAVDGETPKPTFGMYFFTLLVFSVDDRSRYLCIMNYAIPSFRSQFFKRITFFWLYFL